MTKRALYLCILGSVLFAIMLITAVSNPNYSKNEIDYTTKISILIVIVTASSAIYAIKKKDYNILNREKKEKVGFFKLALASYMTSFSIFFISIIIELFIFNTNKIMNYLVEHGIIFSIVGTLICMPVVSKFIQK